MLRKVQDREEARSILEAVECSGVSRARWARQHGIDARSLNAWRINLERWGRDADPPRLVELVAREPVAVARSVVRIGGVAVEVDDHFREETLHRLLGVVAGC